jgi:hypothetical protein
MTKGCLGGDGGTEGRNPEAKSQPACPSTTQRARNGIPDGYLRSQSQTAMVRDPQPRCFYTSFGIREGENGVFLGVWDCSERARVCGRMQRVTWSYPKFVWVFQLIYKIRNRPAVPSRRPRNILLKSESAPWTPKDRERRETNEAPQGTRSDSPETQGIETQTLRLRFRVNCATH